VSDELAIEGGGLRVVFQRLSDRFAHRVEWMDRGGVISLIESIEGDPEDAWPPSPPLQELHFERREGGKQLALLVGRAGASHWSTSIELDPAAAQISFDVACRLRSESVRLGSSYRVRSAALDTLDPSEAGIELSGGLRLHLEGGGDEFEGKLAIWGDALQIQAASLSAPWPKTSRWRYVLSLKNRLFPLMPEQP
jgi:hypothetical protein